MPSTQYTPSLDIPILLLAAGQSKRFGQENKLLAKINGIPLLQHTLETLKQINDNIWVVTNGKEDFSQSILDGCHTVICEDAHLGMGHSLAAGATAILENNSRAPALMIALADQPLVTAQNYQQLLDRYNINQCLVASRYHESLGVPAIFPLTAAMQLKSLTGDIGARKIIRQYTDQIDIVDMPNAEQDIDTPEDLLSIQQQTANNN